MASEVRVPVQYLAMSAKIIDICILGIKLRVQAGKDPSPYLGILLDTAEEMKDIAEGGRQGADEPSREG